MVSLQDQLLKAGLVDEKKAKKANKEKRKQQKVAKRSKDLPVDETKLAVEKARQEKLERDRELNKQKQAEAEQKAIAAQIKQLIQNNKVDRRGGDVDYNFQYDGKFKKIAVKPIQQEHLSCGLLAIVRLESYPEASFEIIPKVIAEKIAERDADAIILQHDKNAQSESSSEEEDWYADYEIPDDLMW